VNWRILIVLLALVGQGGTPGTSAAQTPPQTQVPAQSQTEPLAPASPASSSAAPAAASRAPADGATPPAAGIARPVADDPVLEKRLIALTQELRCMVCQNESLAGSNAPLAIDMRNEIRNQLRDGMSDRQVIDFMVARYGDFVRFRPALNMTTFALWFGPAILLLIGVGVLARQVMRRRSLTDTAAGAPALSATERATLDRLARGATDAPPTDDPGKPR